MELPPEAFSDIIKIMKVAGTMELPPFPWDDLEYSAKSNDMAVHSRKFANKIFMQKMYYFALDLYNISLSFSPLGSENIPLAYGNRSAAYFMMGEPALAIENIRWARESGFPVEKMAQLDDREKKCKGLIEEFGPEEDYTDAKLFLKLSHPPNKKIPFIAGCLELRKSEKYGRYIVSTKDLNTGDIIAIESAAIAWRNTRARTPCCFFCTKYKGGSLLPCSSHCSIVMFCSEECQQKAASFHVNDKLFEVYRGTFQKSLKLQMDAIRIAGGVDQVLELLKGSEDKTIFDFDFSNPEDPSYEKNILLALNGLCKNVQNHELDDVNPEELLNVPPFNEKPRSAEERDQLLKFIISQFQICTSNFTKCKRNHHGIFLFKSLLNHSCIPNVECHKFGKKLVSIVIRPVKAGEQIFVAYEDQTMVKEKHKRSKILQNYQFECDCDACVNDWPQQMPKTDRKFVEPKDENLSKAEAIAEFKKNCKYIDKNAHKMPCYEVVKFLARNYSLMDFVAGIVALE